MFNMHKQCEFFAASVNYNEKDDTSYASWGSMLMHLSMVHEQQVCHGLFLPNHTMRPIPCEKRPSVGRHLRADEQGRLHLLCLTPPACGRTRKRST